MAKQGDEPFLETGLGGNEAGHPRPGLSRGRLQQTGLGHHQGWVDELICMRGAHEDGGHSDFRDVVRTTHLDFPEENGKQNIEKENS